MIRRAVVLAAVLVLAACQRPEPLPPTAPIPVEEAVVADQPLPRIAETVAGAVSAPVTAVQEAAEAILPPPPPPAPVQPVMAACRSAAASLIVRWEVSSPAYYRQQLERPIWPGGASGVTWGIGADGGHQSRATIAADWHAHYAVDRLVTTSGVTGNRARDILPQYRDIITPYNYAYEIFETRALIEYERMASRAFVSDFATLKPGACAALTSVTYNRGASMTGDARREMRVIRDTCLPSVDYACVARELRSMCRLWKGTVNEKGLCARREDEARLAES